MRKQVKMLLSSLSPELTTRLMFRYNFHKRLNLKNPQDFNEKLQYLKLRTYYNNPVITQCVDKYRVREYLEQQGEGRLLPELLAGPFYDARDLRAVWDSLPQSFAIKCNHGCGYNILVKDKSKTNLEDAVKTLGRWLREDYWKIYCEPQYRFVRKAFTVERYLGDNIETYKFY